MKQQQLKHILLFSILSLLFCSTLFAQVFPGDYVSRVWTAADGLPGNTITDIIQNDKGYIYIGTYDGLVKFDGFEFSILNKNTLPNFNCVSARSVFEDSKGVLWVGSNDEGVARIKDDTITMYTVEEGLPNNSVRDIVEDKNGNIWVGTAAGIVYIDPNGVIQIPAGLDENEDRKVLVVSLYCDTAGRIWLLSSKDGGLYCYSGGEFKRNQSLDFLGSYFPTAIGQDMTGAFWVGLAQKGLVRVDDGQVQPVVTNTAMDNSTINDIFLDKSGSLWFGTEIGATLFRDGNYYHYSEKMGLTNNNVKRILEDREGNIWLATDRGGVEKMSMGKFRTQTLPATVNCIAEGKDSLVWVGTDEGLFCFDRNVQIENELTRKCQDIRIRDVSITENGDVVVSAYAKLGQIRSSKKGIVNWTTKEGLAGNKVRVGIETSDKNIYVGTTTGLSVISPNGSIKNYTQAEGLNNDYIMCIYEDNTGKIWIGTDGGGINIMKNGEIVSSMTSQNGLAGNIIFKISQDKVGDIWICTGTGISRYRQGNFFNYTAAEGLGTDSVFQILSDYTDMMWMTSNKGISMVPLSDMDEVMNGTRQVLDPKFFNKNDGLRSGGITSTSLSMCDSLGRLWFTLIDGYAIYDPVKVKSNSTLPLVNIESVVIDDLKINNPNNNLSIIVAPGTKRIEVKYTGLSFISSEMIRFKYMLQGFDNKYSEPSASRVASFTNLKPGKYTLNVMASNSDGVWCNSPATVTFIQKPFFYQRILFWIIIAILVFAILFLAIRMREKTMMETQLRLETMVQVKTVDLEIEKDKSEHLLRNILPGPIAERLKEQQGDKTIADCFDEASVLFLDIVGFTDITSKESPEKIVNALNKLFSLFDVRAEETGVEKIKTIGDSYMAACGIPNADPDHAVSILKFAFGLYDDLKEYNKTAIIPFKVRIGINSGTVIAGVIGKNKFIYDMWGDTVNVASRMESLCNPGEILVTESVKVKADKKFSFSEEIQKDVKGKGLMKTYIVKGFLE